MNRHHPQEKYQHKTSKQFEYFTFIGDHLYKRADGKEMRVLDLRREYTFISTHKGAQTQVWEANPVTGFSIRRA